MRSLHLTSKIEDSDESSVTPLVLSSSSVPPSYTNLANIHEADENTAKINSSSNNDQIGSITQHYSPPKWSLRHLHHHIPSTPSTALSPTTQMQIGSGKVKLNTDMPVVASTTIGQQQQEQKMLRSNSLFADYGDQDTLRQKLTELKDKRRKTINSTDQGDHMLSTSLENLNITGQDDFEKLELFLKESQKEHAIKEALMQGVELREYSGQIEAELRSSESAVIPIYINLCKDIYELHTKVGGCVDILNAFEKLLTSFQSDLSNISIDIKNMQDQSMEKNVKVNNRKVIMAKLLRFIEDISLSPSFVEHLDKGPMDMTYIQLLTTFNRKMAFMSIQRAKGAISIEDMYRKFNTVCDKAIVRVQRHIINQISTIKSSFAQLRETQDELSSMSFLFQFLFIHAPDNARDVKAAYMDTCERFYTAYYKQYISTMSKYLIEIAAKNDVIGIDDNKLKGFFNSKTTKASVKGSVFSLGTRAEILNNLDVPPIDVTTPTSVVSAKCLYEELFRSQLKLLVDQINCEFFFVRDFFLSDDDITMGIFLPCIDLLGENIENYVMSSYDAVGLLILICLIDRFSEALPRNLQHISNALLKATNLTFTRLVYIFDMNNSSIRNADPQHLGRIDTRTHYITRRYSEFLASVLVLYGKLPESLRNHIANYLAKIRESMVTLLHQMSQELDNKNQTVFLINNFDLILSLISLRGVNAEEVSEFTSLLSKAEHAFVSLQFHSTSHISQIASFVCELGPTSDRTDGDIIPEYKKDVAEALLKQFAHHWKEGIAIWHADIPKLFTNFKVGLLLFHQLNDQMISYYKQFTCLIDRCFPDLKSSKFIISEAELLRELQGYDMKI